MKRLTILMLAIAFFSVFSFGQNVNDRDSKFMPLEKVINFEGWGIPEFNKQNPSENLNEIDGLKVKQSTYVLRNGIAQKLESYFQNEKDKTLAVTTRECEIKKISVYSVNNVIFAYAMDYVPVTFSDAVNDRGEVIGKGRSYSYTYFRVFYFDENGDGKFEAKYNFMRNLPSRLPNWLKKQK